MDKIGKALEREPLDAQVKEADCLQAVREAQDFLGPH